MQTNTILFIPRIARGPKLRLIWFYFKKKIKQWMQPICQNCFCFQFLLSPGTKHKTMLEARNGSGTIKAFPRAGVKGKGPVNKGNTGLQNKTFYCEICDVHVNSETQLKQVLSQFAEWESLAILCFHGGKVPTQSAHVNIAVCVQMELTDLSIVFGCHAVCFVLITIFPCVEYIFSKALLYVFFYEL